MASSTSIVYHYLTYDTILPQPSTTGASDPCQPDLKQYASPYQWSLRRKRFITCLSCLATAITAYTAGSYSPATSQMMAEWHVGRVVILLGISLFTVGFAIAPMILAPFSEINGRKPVFIATGILFVVCQVGCAVTRSFTGMLLARFWCGVGSSTFSTMVGGVVSDIYHAEDRNTPMSLFSGAALAGTGLGPLISGFVAYRTTWRWIFYIQIITCSTLMLAVIAFFQETRGSVILSRKAKVLNQWYELRESVGYTGFEMPVDDDDKYISQQIRWKVSSDEERETLSKMIRISLYRPFHMLTTESKVFFFSLWVSFSWIMLYLTFSAIPLVFTATYGFNLEESNAVFASLTVGAVLATIVSIWQDKYTRTWKTFANLQPRHRLYFACVESLLLPIGLFWFGWSSQPHIHWIVPTMGIACATMGIFSIYLATFNYLADTYNKQASSALAAQSFCRNILGGAFPLVTVQMYEKMGTAPACSLLGGIGLLLTGVPWFFLFYFRDRSSSGRS